MKETEEGRYYYKLSNYDSYRSVFGYECINELIVSRLMSVLQIPHLEYQLIHALVLLNGKETETYITRSANFRKQSERKIAFDVFYDLNKEADESPIDFACRYGWGTYIYQMIAIDYLICNRDRHGANIEILVNQRGNARPAPLFDNGLSLLFSCYDDQKSIENFDILKDRPVNNFIGSKSLEYNLQLIPNQEILKGRLKKTDKENILAGLEEILPHWHIEKIWIMIWERWKRYVQICH